MTLVYVLHPYFEQSKRCREVLEHVKTLKNVTIKYVPETYQYTEKNIKAEQEAMEKAERIVFLYPVYWWNLPGSAKMFLDKVFAPGFAYVYGMPHAAKLANKKFRAIITTGGPSKHYTDVSIMTHNQQQIFGDYMGMKVETAFFYFSDQTKDALKSL